MMDGINLYSIDYYNKAVFTGSYKGLCFRLMKESVSADGDIFTDDESDRAGAEVDGREKTVLRAIAWKGPYVLEKTGEEVHERDFDYTDEGLSQANEWLESIQNDIMKEGQKND